MIPQKSRKEIEILGISCYKNDMAKTTEASWPAPERSKTLRLYNKVFWVHTLFKWKNPGWVTSHGKEIIPKGNKKPLHIGELWKIAGNDIQQINHCGS